MASNEDFDTHYSVDNIFAPQLTLYLHWMLVALNFLEKGYSEHIWVSLMNTIGAPLTTFYSDELPKIEWSEWTELRREIILIHTKWLLNNLYEKSKSIKPKDTSNIIEFLRHIRNAASHGWVFEIRPNSLKRVAKWRNKKITPALHWTDLFKFFSVGDIVYLIYDLEDYLGWNSHMAA